MDEVDLDWLSQWKWHAAKNGHTFYAMRRRSSKPRRTIYMHRVILGMQDPQTGENTAPGIHTDHKNHDGLDNRRANLRPAAPTQNQANCRNSRPGTSRYRGVCWYRAKGYWTAYIRADGKREHLGCFRNEEDAAEAYDRAARKLHGEFAVLNFPS